MVPNRVAVVTGANKGIGYFVALQLGLSGLFSDIILGCRDSTRGATAMREIQHQINQKLRDVKVHSLPLEIGNTQSQTEFCQRMEQEFGGSIDVLVNNAGFAYKGADPTPFEQQTAKTFQTNYYGLVDFTEQILPFLRKGTDPRIVNVASMAGRLRQVSPELQARFTDPQLTKLLTHVSTRPPNQPASFRSTHPFDPPTQSTLRTRLNMRAHLTHPLLLNPPPCHSDRTPITPPAHHTLTRTVR